VTQNSAPTNVPIHVAALVDDLMDRSKVTAALPAVRFVRTADACADADVVIVDLARHASAIATVRAHAPDTRIVAFGPHVDDAAFALARADGADATVARSLFFRDPAAAIART
jgi:DNA-binding NarL/FixJ family response regulator